mgnify:CR=1 FL=1
MFPISDSVKTHRIPLINIGLITVTVFVFIQQLIATNQEAFIQTFALVPSLIDFSNYSTLFPFVTAMFLHGGFLHILSNMWFLWVFGDNIEDHMGWLLFLVIYFVSGIAGNLLQYAFMPQSSIPMLGASGAVAGILGAYYVILPHSKIKTFVPYFGFMSVINVPASFMLGYWFILQIISGAASIPGMGETGGVAFFAHAGGFLTGVIFGKLFKREYK